MEFSRHVNALSIADSPDHVRRLARAVFAQYASDRTSGSYRYIPTERVLTGLMQAGYVPVDAGQTHAKYSEAHTRRVVR